MLSIPSSVVEVKKQTNNDGNKSQDIINVADSPEHDSENTATTATASTTTAKKSEDKEKIAEKKKRSGEAQKKKTKEPSPLDVEVNAIDGLDSGYAKYALSSLPSYKILGAPKGSSSLSAPGKRSYYLSSFFVSSKYTSKTNVYNVCLPAYVFHSPIW